MADVFVSYASEDGDIARYVAQGLKHADYDVWEYQTDGQSPGADYLDNIGEGVRQARVVVLFVSPHSIASPQCNTEAQIAWEKDKELIPLLRGITFDQMAASKKGKRWADRIGTRVSIRIDGREPQAVLDAVLAGLDATRRATGGAAVAAGAATSRPPRSLAAPSPLSPERPSGLPGRVVVAGAVGALGLLYGLYSLTKNLAPAAGSPEAWVLAHFGTVKVANLLVNVVGLAQNAALLYGAWLVSRRDPRGGPLIRTVALTMLVAVGIWTVVVLSAFSGARAATLIPNPANRAEAVGGTIFLALVALVPSGIVFWLFRNDRA
jgi:hypothetical protein